MDPISDERLLAYVLEECSETDKQLITERLEHDAAIRERLQFANQVVMGLKVWQPKRTKRQVRPLLRLAGIGAVTVASLWLGMFVQAHFQLLSVRTNIAPVSELSQPLSWDGPSEDIL